MPDHADCKWRFHALLTSLMLAMLMATNAFAAPLRVLTPGTSEDAPEAVAIFAAFLNERLAECRGVEPVRGARAGRIARWLGSGAFDLSDQDRWTRLRSLVSVDAMVEIQVDPGFKDEIVETARVTGTLTARVALESLRFQLFQGDKAQTIIGKELGLTAEGDLAKSVPAAVAALGRRLSLPDDDVARLGEVRIKEDLVFRAYYRTLSGLGPGGVDPLGYLATLSDRTPHWALDVASLRLATSMITAVRRGGEDAIARSTIAAARRNVVRVLATPHESAAFPLLSLDPTPIHAGTIDEIETVLMEVAEPLTKGRLIVGAPPTDRAADTAPAASPAPAGDRRRKGAAPAPKPVPTPHPTDENDDLDDLKDITAPGAGAGAGTGKLNTPQIVKAPDMVGAKTGKSEFTNAERAAAIRFLGRMGSARALPLVERVARRDETIARQAAATALGGYKENHGIEALRQLATDTDPVAAFLAGRSLMQRGQPPDPPDGLKAKAITLLKQPGDHRLAAAETLAALADRSDLPALEALAGDASLAVRFVVRPVLARLSPDSRDATQRLLDPDEVTVIAAIKALPAELPPAVRATLIRLTLDPQIAIAWAARDRLAPQRPADPRGQIEFDLATGHPYTRQRAVAQLVTSTEPWAVELLAAAAANDEPHTRIAALQCLAAREIARARPLLVVALADNHRLVRLHAAALLATHATADQTAAIQAALSRYAEPAFRAYLQDALARAEGKSLPPAPASAHAIPTDRSLAWLCAGGAGELDGSAASPFNAYYQGGLRVTPGWKKVHAAGKIQYARVSPIGNPGYIVIDPLAQDEFWLALDAQVPLEDLPFVDGLVYGEETMSMSRGAMWQGGWRLFCTDTGIDPARVAGSLDKLSVYEQRAWNVWADRRIVEGFNRLYDYTKLRLGKLRPGIGVCTFMGEQMLLGGGSNAAEFEWKFDLGGIYHYIGNSRKCSYALVRRYKTLWPDRPVLWLSNGIGVYERTPIQYTHQGPTAPMSSLNIRAYSDNMTAWIAGADTGLFSIWAFMKWDWVNHGMSSLKGPTIGPEGIMSDPKSLERCVDFSWNGVETMKRTKEEIAAAKGKDISLNTSQEDSLLDDVTKEFDGPKGEDPLARGVREGKDRMITAFRFYGRYLYDVGRFFSSLPRNHIKPDVLAVQPGLSVWEGNFSSPGSDLLDQFDFALDINQLARLDLSRYRFIALNTQAPVTDATIAALTRWLKESPGVLYVYLDVPADNAAQASTPEDFSGKLKLDWPWEADVTGRVAAPSKPGALKLDGEGGPVSLTDGAAQSVYRISGGTKVWLSTGADPVLVLWRSPAFKGAVVFDGVSTGSKDYREALRARLNKLAEQGVGRKLDAPIRQESASSEQWLAASTAGGSAPRPLVGADLVNGIVNPTIGPGKNAALILHDFTGTYIAAANGVSVLTEQSAPKTEKIDRGLKVDVRGVIKAVSATGGMDVKSADGSALPEIKTEDLTRWVLDGKDAGVARQPIGKEGKAGEIVYIRSPGAVMLTTK